MTSCITPRWAEAVLEVGGDFDLATGIILNPDLSRYCDWVSLIENYTFLRPYNEMFDKCQYMTGGYGIYKDYVFVDQCWGRPPRLLSGRGRVFLQKVVRRRL